MQANATNRQTTAITQGAQLQADATAAAANTQATATVTNENNLGLPDAPTSKPFSETNLEQRLAALRGTNHATNTNKQYRTEPLAV